jgi:O-antigen/teichoic acid export membrane protein
MIRRIVQNSLAMISGQFVVKGLGLVWLVVIARHLGETDFGYLNFALSLASIVALIVDFGFTPVLIRAVARDSALAERYVANVLSLRLLLSLLSIPLTLVISLFTGAERATLAPVLIAAVTSLFAALLTTPNGIFIARERMTYPAFILAGSKIVAFAVGLFLVHRGLGIVWIAGVFAFETGLGLVVALVMMNRVLGTRISLAIERPFCRRLFRDALPFALTFALGLISFKIDVVMLSAMKGSQFVGWYSAAYRILEGLVYISIAFVSTVFPTLSRLKVADEHTLRTTVQRATEFVIAFALPIALAIVFLASDIIALLYGEPYAPSTAALRWIGAALLFVFVNGFLGSVLEAIDRQHLHFRGRLVAVLVNVALNIFLIPRLAHVGAAIATLVTEATLSVCLGVLVARHVRPRLLAARLGKIGAAAVLLVATLGLLRGQSFWLALLGGAAVYLGVLAAMRVLTPEETANIRKAFRRTGDE